MSDYLDWLSIVFHFDFSIADMPKPCKCLVCPDVTPYYPTCTICCVPPCFFVSMYRSTIPMKDLSHRKARIEELMFKFAAAFALDVMFLRHHE